MLNIPYLNQLIGLKLTTGSSSGKIRAVSLKALHV